MSVFHRLERGKNIMGVTIDGSLKVFDVFIDIGWEITGAVGITFSSRAISSKSYSVFKWFSISLLSWREWFVWIISWSNDGNRPQHDLQPSQQHSMHPKLPVQKIAIIKITSNIVINYTILKLKIELTKAKKGFDGNNAKNINTWTVELINVIKVDRIAMSVAKYVAKLWSTIIIKTPLIFTAIHCFSYQLSVRIVLKPKSICIAFASTNRRVANALNELDTWKTSEINADGRCDAGHNTLRTIWPDS